MKVLGILYSKLIVHKSIAFSEFSVVLNWFAPVKKIYLSSRCILGLYFWDEDAFWLMSCDEETVRSGSANSCTVPS